ncbi:MAG: hypothetical protein MJ179_04725 [Treponema sp.]|nr:hypothetical protein [Treponema sp.]
MKKFVLCALSAFLILSFVSCGSDPTNADDNPDAPAITTPEDIDNATILEAVESARKLALESGAEDKAADKLEAIDKLFEDLKTKSEDEKQDISKDGKDIADRYLALAGYITAKDAKEKIDGTDMIFIVQSLYDEGCTALAELEEMYNDPEVTGAQLLSKATSASTALNTALLTIYKKIAKDERDAAMASKKNADSVKAGVSMKAKYNEAVSNFKTGDSLFSMQNAAKAYDNYKIAKEIFDELFEEVSAKREAALRAIEEAKKAVNETESFAEEADIQAPITGPVEGIEEEDAVLLEEETYADPSEAEAELPENPDDPVQDAINEALENAAESVSGVLGGEK